MDLQVTQENLNKALGNVARVASGRSTLPILSNVLIKADNNRLTISATNLDIAITQHIGSKIDVEGSVTIPARLFQDFVNNLPSGTIHLRQEDHKLHIEAGTYQSTINGTAADEFPVMPTIQKSHTITLGADELKHALQQVVFAASSDETRPVLTGVYVYTHDGELFIAATDSYRLAEKRVQKLSEEVALLVPSSALQDLLRILGDNKEKITITYDDQQVLFKVGEVDLVARLIDGKYPDYKKLIPSKFDSLAVVSKSELVNITKISSLFSRESAGSVTVVLNEKNKTLSIQSVASQVGENTASTSGEVVGDGTITLNSRYLLDGLQAIVGDEVQFGFNGKLEPIIVRGAGDTTYTHVVMPLKS